MKRKKSLEMSGLVASTISQIRKVFANKKFGFKGSSKSWPMHENDTASLECLVLTLFILHSPLWSSPCQSRSTQLVVNDEGLLPEVSWQRPCHPGAPRWGSLREWGSGSELVTWSSVPAAWCWETLATEWLPWPGGCSWEAAWRHSGRGQWRGSSGGTSCTSHHEHSNLL